VDGRAYPKTSDALRIIGLNLGYYNTTDSDFVYSCEKVVEDYFDFKNKSNGKASSTAIKRRFKDLIQGLSIKGRYACGD
jgi:hypothetical protein